MQLRAGAPHVSGPELREAMYFKIQTVAAEGEVIGAGEVEGPASGKKGKCKTQVRKTRTWGTQLDLSD